MFGVSRRWWTVHWQEVIFDGLPPLVLLGLGVGGAYGGYSASPGRGVPALASVLPGAVACLALFLRRHRPLLTLAVVMLAVLLPQFLLPGSLTYWDEFTVVVVALFSCARHLRRRRALVGLSLAAVFMALLPFGVAELRDPSSMAFNSALLAAGFAVGLLARSWTGYRERTIRAELEQAAAEERAVAQERERIARELHDVISHTITVIVMQAGGARLASQADPRLGQEALQQIEDLGRASLGELRTLLPLLGTGGRPGPAGTTPTPQPTLADVGALCERMRRIGLPVVLQAGTDTDGLPLGLQLTAYRVVQEGLTNVVRHAGKAPATVRIALAGAGASLAIEVENGVADGLRHAPGSRRGLRGLQERVRLAGGELQAGPAAHGGFLLKVRLPVARVPA